MDASAYVPPPRTVTTSPATPAVDRPGRWVGGLIGALVSLAFAIAVVIVGRVAAVDVESLTILGLLGVPVAFVLGRAALPWVRDGGWRHAAVVGMALGWAAPPLGALEIVLGMGMLEGLVGQSAVISCDVPGLVAAPIFLVYAVPFSFIAIVVTIPLGIAWGLATHAVPDRWLARARMPRPIAALGVRHLAALVLIVVGGVLIVQIAATPPCPFAMLALR